MRDRGQDGPHARPLGPHSGHRPGWTPACWGLARDRGQDGLPPARATLGTEAPGWNPRPPGPRSGQRLGWTPCPLGPCLGQKPGWTPCQSTRATLGTEAQDEPPAPAHQGHAQDRGRMDAPPPAGAHSRAWLPGTPSPARRPRALTCGVVVRPPAALHADLHQRLQPLRLPVPHPHAHRLGGSAEPRACVGNPRSDLCLQPRLTWTCTAVCAHAYQCR